MSQTPLRLVFRATQPLQRHHDPRSYFQACRAITTHSFPQPLGSMQASASYNPLRPSSRKFSNTTAARATVVLQNPRVDDDGNDMSIEISDRAAKRLKQITSSPPRKNTLTSSSSSPESHLRVTVTSGGCHGFQYMMSLEDSSKVDQEEDTVFAVDSSDATGDKGKAEVVMDLPSLELLKGSTVDFTTELIGSQFKIVGNPRAKSSCGCGTSFDIE